MLLKYLLLAVLVVQLNGQEDDPSYGGVFDISYGQTTAAPTTAASTTAAPVPRIIPNPAPLEGPNETCENGGECVPYYLCTGNNTINTDGEGIIDIRFAEDEAAAETPCKDYMVVCCGTSDITDTPIPPPEMEYKPGCGHRNIKGVGGFQIKGGSQGESEFGEFPWMVAVLKESKVLDQILNVYQCGGSLIHPSVVLTAAHCVHDKQPHELKIRAGEWDTQTKKEIFAHEDRDVQSKKVHEGFVKGTLANDVALLFLAGEPLELAPNINTICLPPQDHSFDNQRCFASGWGKDVFGKEGKYQVILKKVELPIMPHATCQANMRTTRLGMRFNLHNSFVCAGGEKGVDTCKGDGGSPLVCPVVPGSFDRYYQTGVVAWGIGCGEKNIPGVYGRVSLFRNWIDMQFTEKGLEKKFYIAQ